MSSTPATAASAGKGAGHGKPPADWECAATFEDITEEEGNYVEFQSAPSGTWHPAKFSKATLLHLQATLFDKYMKDVEKASKDCAAAVRRLVSKGPPLYVSDPVALKLPEGDTHVAKLWFMDEDREVSAKLVGAPEGAEREALWNAQKEVLAAMEIAEATSGDAATLAAAATTKAE